MINILTGISCIVIFLIILYLFGIIGNKINHFNVSYIKITKILDNGLIYFIVILIGCVVIGLAILILYIIGMSLLFGLKF